MTLSASHHADVYTDFQGLTKLRTEARKESPEALREAARQFEALFLQMMLKSMREANLGEGIMDNDQSRLYQGMYDQQIGLELSKGRGLGLAEVLARQLGDRSPQPAADLATRLDQHARVMSRMPPQAAAETASPSPTPAATEAVPAARAVDGPWRPESPEAFVQELWPHAERAAAELGTRPEVLVAQSALETGWGRSVMHHADGRPSYNLFGIKADARWDGDKVYSRTMEFRDGVMQRERAAFRSYESLAEGFQDYVAFLKENPRYRQALEAAQDGPAYVRELQKAGYATDPDYADKINAIMDGLQLADAREARNG